MSGKLLGHYPVAVWLRVTCSSVKRSASRVERDEKIPDGAQRMSDDMLEMVMRNVPAQGKWNVGSGDD